MKALIPIAAAMLVGAVFFAAPAFAADPLACDDERMLQKVRENLQNAGANAQPPLKLVELKEPKEVLLGAPPASATQYARATTYIAISRYCEGLAEFETGEPEPVYWRLDQLKDGADESTRFDVCHKLWDQFEDGCKAYRPEG